MDMTADRMHGAPPIGVPTMALFRHALRAGWQDFRAAPAFGLIAAGLCLIAEETGSYSVDSGYAAAAALLDRATVDGLICANDAMAIGAIGALADRQVQVPRDISIVGFDDIAMAAWPAFALTTVRNPVAPLVAEVLRLLAARHAAPDRPDETVFLQTDLVLRGSH